MDYPLEHTIDDAQQICIKRIKAGSLFKLVASATFSFFVPLIVFFGILALFGFPTIRVNFRPVVGIQGLLTALIMAPFFSLILSVIVWVAMYFGIRIWGCFAPLTISYVPGNKPKV
jgi:hypothetical protein